MCRVACGGVHGYKTNFMLWLVKLKDESSEFFFAVDEQSSTFIGQRERL